MWRMYTLVGRRGEEQRFVGYVMRAAIEEQCGGTPHVALLVLRRVRFWLVGGGAVGIVRGGMDAQHAAYVRPGRCDGVMLEPVGVTAKPLSIYSSCVIPCFSPQKGPRPSFHIALPC